jgi:DUF4097 and DUF4098 domain-containing protein YvlB
MPSLSAARRTRFATVALSIILSALFSAGCGLHFTPDVEARAEWTRRYTLTSGGTLEIRNTNGKIQVRPSDGNVVEVVATRIAKARDEAAAKELLTRVEIKESAAADRILLDSRGASGHEFGGSRQVDYVVRMPASASLTVATTNGDVDVEGVGGVFTATATNGRVRASGLQDSAKVETTNGEVTLELVKLGSGGVTCETTNGVIDVSIPRNAKADLSARVTNGDIDFTNLDLAVKEKSRRRFDASIGGGGPAIRLEATNGAISVRGK